MRIWVKYGISYTILVKLVAANGIGMFFLMLLSRENNGIVNIVINGSIGNVLKELMFSLPLPLIALPTLLTLGLVFQFSACFNYLDIVGEELMVRRICGATKKNIYSYSCIKYIVFVLITSIPSLIFINVFFDYINIFFNEIYILLFNLMCMCVCMLMNKKKVWENLGWIKLSCFYMICF